MLRVGYLGSLSAPEFSALHGRKNVQLTAFYAPPGSAPGDELTGAQRYERPDALITEAEVDVCVLALPPHEQAPLTRVAADRGRSVFVAPPIAESLREAEHTLQAVRDASIIVSVGWPMRYAINLIQLRHMVRRDGVRWAHVRVTAKAKTISFEAHVAPACDLLRYAAGEVTGVREVTVAPDGTLTAMLVLRSGAYALLSAATKCADERMHIEVIAGRNILGWSSGTRHLTINDEDHHVAETPDGLYVAEIAAFLTAVETGWTSPILCDYADAVETFRLCERIEKAGGRR